jgi:hypothetical protein
VRGFTRGLNRTPRPRRVCCVRLTQAEFGALHVLFNNAGVMLMDDDDAVRFAVAFRTPEDRRRTRARTMPASTATVSDASPACTYQLRTRPTCAPRRIRRCFRRRECQATRCTARSPPNRTRLVSAGEHSRGVHRQDHGNQREGCAERLQVCHSGNARRWGRFSHQHRVLCGAYGGCHTPGA